MTESWNNMPFTTAMLSPHKAPEPVSQADLNALLGGRKFNLKQEPETPFEMNPPIPEFDEAEMKELQDFCAKYGIIGVNFKGDNPKTALRKLKARMGIVEQTTKKGILHG